jgi:glucose/arabinose dehydrogenase
MHRSSLALLSVVALACNGAAEPGNTPDDGEAVATGVALEEVVNGLERPVYLTAPEGDPRLFIVEQPGRIRIVEGGTLRDEPFLDIESRVRSQGNEQGLLSMAFHPRFSENGYFYVNYTGTDGNTRVERYSVSADANRADPASAKLIIGYDQPYANHNGGHILFGPDGMLYIPTGDGGSGGDPQNRAQNLSSLLGKMLRIDVDGGDPYAIPSDNPFVGRADVRPEIWAYGLRNPWRVAFDEQAGLLYVADVGQNAWEEVSVVPADQGGINFGWKRLEGTHCFSPESGCDRNDVILPVVEYPHSEGISITGGYVYRGSAIPELQGKYLFADFGRSWIKALEYENGQAADTQTLEIEVPSVSSFGLDGEGELYIVSLSGRVLKVVPDA